MYEGGMIKVTIKEVVGSYFQCVRSRTIAIVGYPYPALISYFIASGTFSQGTSFAVFKLGISLSLMALGVYWLNDLFDLDDDLKNLEMGNPNQADRPFSSGEISETRLKMFISVNFISSLIVAYFINLTVFGLNVVFMILGIFYSAEPVRLRKRFLQKQTTITMALLLSVLMGAYTAGGVNTPILYMLVLQFLLGMGVGPLMDVRDMRGDIIMGVKSLPVVFGPKMVMRLYFATLVVMLGAGLVGYSMVGFNIAMPLLVAMIMGSWIYVSLPLLRKLDDPIIYGEFIAKRAIPLLILIQLTPLIGVMNLPF
jgi:4-hydroxybenzoate polyprenyltransferase